MQESLSEKANALPLLPGVYIMLDKDGQVIYVGKAIKLKNRVSSYFHGAHNAKVSAMVAKVCDFNVIMVADEMEALILENSLIKKYQPHYNILLKDDKGYPFIRVDYKGQYPEISLASKPGDKKSRYYGPYGSRGRTKDIIDAVKTGLKLPSCRKKFPSDIGKDRPCLNYHLGKCAGWCTGSPDAEEYSRRISQAVQIFEGKGTELCTQLRQEMTDAADRLEFELAAQLRDRAEFISSFSKQRVVATSYIDMDVIGYFRGARLSVVFMRYYNGDLADKSTFLFDDPYENDGEALSEILREYYLKDSVHIPKNILIPFETGFDAALSSILTESAGHRVEVSVPVRGEKAALIQKASVNAEQELKRRLDDMQRSMKTLEILQKMLRLDNYPERIEAFDISNLGDTGIVSGMTVTVNGKFSKSNYRKFRLSEISTQDDYASMHAVITRRFTDYIDKKQGFEELPDLLLIDGGDRHAQVAVDALSSLGLSLPVFGMVKDDRHRTRALITPNGEEIGISANQAVFSFVGGIQEETHRYSIEYQKSLRKEKYASVLDGIPGIGPKRKEQLYKRFRSLKAIKLASTEELAAVLPPAAAQSVYDYLHGGDIKE